MMWRLFTSSENVGNLFSVTENLVTEKSTEILNVSTTDCRSLCWTESTQAHDQVKKWSKAKVRVYLDSSCLGKVTSSTREKEKEKWSNQVNEFKSTKTVDEDIKIVLTMLGMEDMRLKEHLI